MPHFIVEYSAGALCEVDRSRLMEAVCQTAAETSLFNMEDIKVRLREYEEYLTGGDGSAFLRVFGWIMGAEQLNRKSGCPHHWYAGSIICFR